MEQSKRWSRPPWEITGEELTRVRRLTWRIRDDFYMGEYNSMVNRKRNEMELKRLQSG